MSLTIAFVTSRHEPKFEWFFDSLIKQCPEEQPQIIVIDSFAAEPGRFEVVSQASNKFKDVWHSYPKPTIWSGPHRITKQDWWSVSNARNTALCLCRNSYIVWVDDRSVLSPQWMQGIQAAIEGNYAVCGTYEKWHEMKVEGGVVIHLGIFSGRDVRNLNGGVTPCYGQFWGGTYGMPLTWALEINGFEEMLDGGGAEDYMCGFMLCNNGYVTMFDPRMKIIQDRTPVKSGPHYEKRDKGVSPNDKSHAAIDKFGCLKRCAHPWNMAEIRETVLRGGNFPSVDSFPRFDWYDGQPIAEM